MSVDKQKMGAALSLLNLMMALPVLLAFSGQWEFVVVPLLLYWWIFKGTSFLNQFRQVFPQTNRVMWAVMSAGLVAAILANLNPSFRSIVALLWVIFALTLVLPIARKISKM